MNKNYLFIILINIFVSIIFSRSMEFNSCKMYAGFTPPDYEKAIEFGLLALEVEPDNSEIPLFLGKLYRKQNKRLEAGRMFLEALNRPDADLANFYRSGKKKITTVHEEIPSYGADWYNYGVDSYEKGNFDEAIEYFTLASKLDTTLLGSSYKIIADIYYEDKKELNQALEFINTALSETKDEKIILDLKLSKTAFLRNNDRIDEAKEVIESISNSSDNIYIQYELFLIHMDNNDCTSATKMGENLFLEMENDPFIPMSVLSELAFNIAACFNQKADIGYNQIFDYLKSKNKTNELTNFWIESCEGVKEDYSLARKYFRSALNWDENSSEATKTFKREMKDNINKIEDDIIPLLEDILK